MNRTNLLRGLPIVCVMAIIVVVIYRAQIHLEKQKQEQVAREETKATEQQRVADMKVAEQQRKTEIEAASAQFVNQYVNTNFTRTAGLPLVAVAVADENRAMNLAMSAALIRRFKNEPAQLVDSFFKPPLVSDRLFDDAFNGSSALFKKLKITDSVDALLLARQSVGYSTNAELDSVITANMRIQIVTLPIAGQVESHEWTFTANGTGFHPAEARMQAEERIVKQITDKTDMTLGLINSKH